MKEKKLYIVPVGISQDIKGQASPWPIDKHILDSTRLIFAENLRSARRSLRSAGFAGDLNAKQWVEIKREASVEDIYNSLLFITPNSPALIISESGMPCIADPGSFVVAIAHSLDIKVIPLPGPSSIFLAIAASGLDGQKFSFHGYLPIKSNQREVKVKELAKQALTTGYTQVFMETPYRNSVMFDTIIKATPGSLRLCIAADITGEHQYIKTLSVERWREINFKIEKVPCLFLLGR